MDPLTEIDITNSSNSEEKGIKGFIEVELSNPGF